QAGALEKIYAPLRNPRTNQEIYPGATRISQPNWAEAAARQALNASSVTTKAPPSLESVLFNKAEWDWRTVNFHSDVTFADEADAKGPQINAQPCSIFH